MRGLIGFEPAKRRTLHPGDLAAFATRRHRRQALAQQLAQMLFERRFQGVEIAETVERRGEPALFADEMAVPETLQRQPLLARGFELVFAVELGAAGSILAVDEEVR